MSHERFILKANSVATFFTPICNTSKNIKQSPQERIRNSDKFLR